MPSSRKVTLVLFMVCAVWPGPDNAAPSGRSAQAGHTASAASPQGGVTPSAARREWDTRRDWIHFTTGVLGDTAVTDPMKALLASGLGPGTQDKYGRTALHAATLLGQLELARFLLSKGANVNGRDNEGRTPLMVSVSAGGFDHFRGFATVSPWGLIWTEPVCDLERPAERSAAIVQGFDDWRDMVLAQRPMVRLLLEAGADVSLKDSNGRDAIDHAARGGPTGLDRLLPTGSSEGKQSRCDLNLTRSPEVRGLRLGMTLQEATSRFRPSKVPEAEWCGRQTLEFDWADDLLGQPAPCPQELAGVRRIRLGFLDRRLAYFRVTYDPKTAPLTTDQFRSTLSSALALPGVWRTVDGAQSWEQLYSIGCEGFVAVAGYEIGPYVELHDTGAIDLLLRRRQEERQRRRRSAEDEKERRRRVFKP